MPLASAMERADAVTLASVWKTLWSGMDLSHVVEQWRNEFTIEDVHEVLRFLLVITLSGEQDASKRTMQLEQRLNDVWRKLILCEPTYYAVLASLKMLTGRPRVWHLPDELYEYTDEERMCREAAYLSARELFAFEDPMHEPAAAAPPPAPLDEEPAGDIAPEEAVAVVNGDAADDVNREDETNLGGPSRGSARIAALMAKERTPSPSPPPPSPPPALQTHTQTVPLVAVSSVIAPALQTPLYIPPLTSMIPRRRGRKRQRIPWSLTGKLWARIDPETHTRDKWEALSIDEQHAIKNAKDWPRLRSGRRPG